MSFLRKYTRKKCSIYERDFGRRRKWHKAVASHSRLGDRNPNALSKYLPNEEMMSHEERKAFVLPCKYTLAQSWGAVRRGWLGFKIAKSRGDTARMTYYAEFISKVKSEMGIEKTIFDSDILKDQIMTEEPDPNCNYTRHIDTKIGIEERTIDYDNIMNEARAKAGLGLTGTSGINKQSDSACTYIRRLKSTNNKATKTSSGPSKYNKSCSYKLPSKTYKSSNTLSSEKNLKTCGFKYFRKPYNRLSMLNWHVTKAMEVERQEHWDESDDPCWYQPSRDGDENEELQASEGEDSCWYQPSRDGHEND